MGGGPRTFLVGLSKSQHKRMHEKLARQKERGLLRHEKQLYLARLRSEIRASHHPGAAATSAYSPVAAVRRGGPTSSRAHIRALADRFLQPGAEDLWNEDDGPLPRARSPQPLPHPQSVRSLPSGVRLVDWDQADSGGKPPRRGGGGDWNWDELNSEEPRAWRETGNMPRFPALNPKIGFSQRGEYGTVAPWWWQWSSGPRIPSSFGLFGPKRCYSVMPPCMPRRRSELCSDAIWCYRACRSRGWQEGDTAGAV